MLLTSFYTHTINLSSQNLIESRMTFSDVFGLLALFIFWVDRLINRGFFRNIPKLYYLGGISIVFISFSIISSLSYMSTLFEVLILCYLIFLSFTLYSVFNDDFKTLTYLLIGLSFLMSFTGLYDLFAANNNLPVFFNETSIKHATSGFRYFAQAGNYSFTLLTILIPLKYSKLFENESVIVKRILGSVIVLTILFMLATGAISIIISFLIGCLIFLAFNFRNKLVLKDTFYVLSLILFFIGNVYFLANNLYQNLIFRIQSRVTNRQVDTPEASFIIQNLKDTIIAFRDNYLLGTGLGGFVNNYSEFEIHGTYLKMIGETGLVGSLGYFVFLYFFIRFIIKEKGDYFKCFIPFFLSSLISWSYNYHLRKKEFWVLFAFLLIISSFNKNNIKSV